MSKLKYITPILLILSIVMVFVVTSCNDAHRWMNGNGWMNGSTEMGRVSNSYWVLIVICLGILIFLGVLATRKKEL